MLGVQPRIRLWRSFDQRSHSYLGYLLRVEGVLAGESGLFTLGIGKTVQARHEFQAGDEVQGFCQEVADPRLEPAAYYKVSQLKLWARAAESSPTSPPWLGPPPNLETYRARGHRRLAGRTYASKCQACIWGCAMAVEIIVDHWNPQIRRYRRETFCYGPKSCSLYRAGPPRTVPGRQGMTWTEEDWIDEDATAHRTEDE